MPELTLNVGIMADVVTKMELSPDYAFLCLAGYAVEISELIQNFA